MDISNKEAKICYDSAWNIIDDIVKDIGLTYPTYMHNFIRRWWLD